MPPLSCVSIRLSFSTAIHHRSLSLRLTTGRRLSLFHFTGARFPEISSTYYTHHYTPPPPPPPPTSTSLSPARSLYLRLTLSLSYSPRYANLPLHHVSLACSHEAAAGGGGGGGSARCGPHGRPRARIQAVSGGQVDTSGGDAALSVGVVGVHNNIRQT